MTSPHDSEPKTRSNEQAELKRWQDGDRRAGNLIVRRYYPNVAGFFMNAVSDEDRPDLVQETFRRLVVAKDGYRGDVGVRTYIFALARAVLFDYLRRRYREQPSLDPLTHSVEDFEGATPSKMVSELQRSQRLLACLRALPVDTKQMLELYYWQGCTAEELGRVFASDGNAVPSGTIRRRIHDAVSKLRACLAADAAPATQKVTDDIEVELQSLGKLLAEGPSQV